MVQIELSLLISLASISFIFWAIMWKTKFSKLSYCISSHAHMYKKLILFHKSINFKPQHSGCLNFNMIPIHFYFIVDIQHYPVVSGRLLLLAEFIFKGTVLHTVVDYKDVFDG